MRWIAAIALVAIAGTARADERTPIVTADDPAFRGAMAFGAAAAGGVAYVVVAERSNACSVWSSSNGGLTWARFATPLGICAGGVVIVAVRGLRRSTGDAWTAIAGPWRDDDPPRDVIAIGGTFYALAGSA